LFYGGELLFFGAAVALGGRKWFGLTLTLFLGDRKSIRPVKKWMLVY